MSYIVRLTCDEMDVRYVAKLHGFMAPDFTYDIKKARRFETCGEAQKIEQRLREASSREGSETVTVEMLEYREGMTDSVDGESAKAAEVQRPEFSDTHSEHYRDSFGEPAMTFKSKSVTLCMYTKKTKEGRFYAYTINNGPFEVTTSDGEAAMTAFCKAARDIIVMRMRKIVEKQESGNE